MMFQAGTRVINKAALSSRLKKSAGLSHREASRYVDIILDALIEGACRGERIELRGFGAFETKRVSFRELPAAFSSKDAVPAHGRLAFRPCRKLRDAVWNRAE